MKRYKILLMSGCTFISYNAFSQLNTDLSHSIIDGAASCSKAAYNPKSLVEVKSFSTRTQMDQESRFELSKIKQIAHFNSTLNGKDSPAGIITYEKKGNISRLYVAYHGTESFKDILTDINATKYSNDVIGLEGYSHGGFMKRYLESRDSLKTVLEHEIERLGINTKELEIIPTGHSMGGAIATIAAMDIQKNLVPDAKVNLVTQCSPRVFDHDAVNHGSKILKGKALRIWTKGDPVAAVSIGTSFGSIFKKFTGFKHFGESFALESRGWGLCNHSLDWVIGAIKSNTMLKPVAHQGWKNWLEDKTTWSTELIKSTLKKINLNS